MRLLTRKGQSTGEYAILIAVAIGAIVAMQIYVKRGLQAKVKGTTDFLTQTGTGTGTLKQYEPYYNESDYTVAQDRKAAEATKIGGAVDRTAIDEKTTRTGSSTTAVDQDKDTAWK